MFPAEGKGGSGMRSLVVHAHRGGALPVGLEQRHFPNAGAPPEGGEHASPRHVQDLHLIEKREGGEV